MIKSVSGFSRLGACALLGVVIAFAGDANANQLNVTPGGCGIVKAGSWSAAVSPAWLITRNVDGSVGNPDATAHDVTCPVPRIPAFSGGGAQLFVDIGKNFSDVTTCTLYSYNLLHGLDGSVTASSSGTGHIELSLTLSGAQAGPNNYFDLKCNVSNNNNTVIYGYSLEEF